jgi:hypothetical protein
MSTPLESTHSAQPAGSSHSAACVCYGTGSRCGPSHGRTNAAAVNLRHLLTLQCFHKTRPANYSGVDPLSWTPHRWSMRDT